MDYKAMWEELKAKVESDLEYYEDGTMCSMAESINGVLYNQAVLNDMKTLEEKYSDL